MAVAGFDIGASVVYYSDNGAITAPAAYKLEKMAAPLIALYPSDSDLDVVKDFSARVMALTCLLDLDSFDKLYGHPAYGACWEGFAVENILATLQPRGMYGFYRTRTGEGIDLVIERQGKRLGFEFKTSSSPRLTNGNKAAAALLDLDKLFVVVPQGDAYPIETDRIWVTPLDEIDRHVSSE